MEHHSFGCITAAHRLYHALRDQVGIEKTSLPAVLAKRQHADAAVTRSQWNC